MLYPDSHEAFEDQETDTCLAFYGIIAASYNDAEIEHAQALSSWFDTYYNAIIA